MATQARSWLENTFRQKVVGAYGKTPLMYKGNRSAMSICIEQQGHPHCMFKKHLSVCYFKKNIIVYVPLWTCIKCFLGYIYKGKIAVLWNKHGLNFTTLWLTLLKSEINLWVQHKFLLSSVFIRVPFCPHSFQPLILPNVLNFGYLLSKLVCESF